MPVRREGPAAERPAIPQGLSLADPGLSGIPSLSRPPAPLQSALGEAAAARRKARTAAMRQTVLPSCLVLGITLPLLAIGWFMLDRFSVLRDNPLGLALPITLLSVGALFLATSLLLIAQSRRAVAVPDAN